MKRSMLICDRHLEETGDEILAVERIAISSLTSGSARKDVCKECYDELIDLLPMWLTIESNGQRTTGQRRRTPKVTTRAGARDENKRRDSKNRYVICNRCDDFVSLNNMTGHNTAWHDAAPRDWREV